MLTGLSFLFVGAVLSLNGIWMLGRIGDRESAVINLVTAAVTIAVAASLALGANATLLTVRAAALTLLFSTTYLWVAANRIFGFGGRGLGWFSLFVAITVLPVAAETWVAARALFAIGLRCAGRLGRSCGFCISCCLPLAARLNASPPGLPCFAASRPLGCPAGCF
jgi:hypothetical protein